MTAPHLPDAIEHLPTDALVPYARNSRTHSPEQVAQIAASIREFGFTNPVLIDANNTLIAGHGRVMAAQQLGLTSVPAIRLAHLSDAQRRAYVIADNQLALNAGWDMSALARELEDLSGEGFDIDLLGFGADELTALLGQDEQAESATGNTDADAVPPEPVTPATVLGDVWLMGKHRVMCGDSTDSGHVAQLMAGQLAALVHADPPYGMGKENEGVANDNLYAARLDAFQMSWWRIFRAALENNASAYVWGNAPDLWRLWYAGGLLTSERMTIRNHLHWRKGNNVQGLLSETNRSYPPAGEMCLFFMLGEQGFNSNADNYWEGWEPIRRYLANQVKAMEWTAGDVHRITGVGMFSHWFTRSQWVFITEKHYNALKAEASGKAFKRDHDTLKRDHDTLKRDHDTLKRDFYGTRAYFDNTHEAMSDAWDYPVVTGDDRHGHATPKPVAMMERVMKSSLPPGGLCAEPFGGSGSTLMGAEKTGRNCYTMELQPRYVDVIVTRWQQFTGKQATLEATGQTFEQVKARRLANSA